MSPCRRPADRTTPGVPRDGDARHEPPPPLRYEEPVTGPAGHVLGRTIALLVAPIAGFACGCVVAFAITKFARSVAETVGGDVTSPALVSVMAGALVWVGWRWALRARAGSLAMSALELLVGVAMLPLLLVLILSVPAIVYALIR